MEELGSSSCSRVGTLGFNSLGVLWEELGSGGIPVLSRQPFLNLPTNVSEYVADFLVDTHGHVLSVSPSSSGDKAGHLV